jgi:hypothetical protein
MRRFLELLVIPPRQRQQHCTKQSIIDYRISIIITSNDYIAALEEIAAKEEAMLAEQERKKEEAKHTKVECACRKAKVDVEKRKKQERRHA